MKISDDRYRRHRRAFDLAWRMIGHGARTNTISRWTGLTERRIRRLQRSYGVETAGTAPKRPRGRSPYRVELLLRAPRMRKEAVAAARLCWGAGLLSSDPGDGARRMQPDIEKGERLCGVFEAFKSAFPDSIITIEQSFLLVAALSSREEIELAHCLGCGQVAIVDRLQVAPQRCGSCGRVLCSEANSHPAYAARILRPSGLERSASLDRSLTSFQRGTGCSPSTSSTCKGSQS
jgi:hypothetical protein